MHSTLLFRLLCLILFISAAESPALMAQGRLQRLDDRIMLNIAETRTPQKTGLMLFLTHTIKYGDIGVPAALLAGGIIGNNYQMKQNSLYVASSTAISYGVTLLLKQLVKRRRPFIQNIKIIPVYRAGSTSFPSGHASTTFATATALSTAYPKWYVIVPAFLWAGSVSYSRMYLGEHYPTDVATGAAIGTATAILLLPLKK